MAKQSFNTAYKTWRNRIRKFSVESIINAAFAELRRSYSKIDALKAAPWNVLLIVKWVCQDKMMDASRVPITRQQFDDLRQQLWDFGGQVDIGISNSLPWRLFMRRTIYQQMLFQRKFRRDFAREAALLLRENPTHSLRQMFKAKTGMDIAEFLDLATYTIARIFEGRTTLDVRFFDPLRKVYSDATIRSFIAGVSLNVAELKEFCRSLPENGEKVQSEYYEFPVLSRYPFLRVDDRLECWHIALLQHGLENFVHAVMIEYGQNFTDPYGKIFERHVRSVAQSLKGEYFDEEGIKDWLPPESRVPDCLLHFCNCNVIVEAKSGAYREAVMTVGNSEIFVTKTKGLRDAVQQGWAAVTGIRTQGKAPGSIMSCKVNYLLVVTNKEVSAGSGQRLAEMYPSGKLVPPSADAAELLPLSHVYFLSIEDFETIVQAVARGDIDLPTFLSDCVTADADPQTSVFHMTQHISGKNIFAEVSPVVANALDESMRRLEAAVLASST